MNGTSKRENVVTLTPQFDVTWSAEWMVHLREKMWLPQHLNLMLHGHEQPEFAAMIYAIFFSKASIKTPLMGGVRWHFSDDSAYIYQR